MDLKILAEHLNEQPIYPCFTICHIIACTLFTRSDLGSGSLLFSRKHPLACWLSTMLCVFSTTILTNFLLNEPVLSAFNNTQQVLLATLAWYLIFYSPFDFVHKTCTLTPIQLIIMCMNDIHNCKAIYQGITHAEKIFPDSYAIMLIIGIARGNGPSFTRALERLIRGSWALAMQEFMQPSCSTKLSALASLAFIINKHTQWLQWSQAFVLFCVVCASIYMRLLAALVGVANPFEPVENVLCLILFGGIWDALERSICNNRRRTFASGGGYNENAAQQRNSATGAAATNLQPCYLIPQYATTTVIGGAKLETATNLSPQTSLPLNSPHATAPLAGA